MLNYLFAPVTFSASVFLGIIGEIINYVFSLVFALIYNIAKIGMMLIGYSSHVDVRSAWIENSWYKSLALVDFLIVFMVIILALAYALRWNIETYEIKKTLPSVIGGFIAAHFSLLFIRGALDFAEILTNYFMGDSSGENIAMKLMRLCTGVDFDQLNFFMNNFDSSSSSSIGFLQTVPLLAGLALLVPGAGIIAIPILIIWAVLVLIPVILIFGIGLVLLLRKIVLTILIICSPIIIILYFFPPTKSYGQQYITALFQWIFLAPIVLLLLSVATYFGPGTDNKITYLHEVKHLIAYCFDYHSWVAIVHAAPSPSATPITAGNYGAIENFIQGWINWMAGILIMFMALTLPFQMGGIGSQIIKGLGDLVKRGSGYIKNNTAIPEWASNKIATNPNRFVRWLTKIPQELKSNKDMYKAGTEAEDRIKQREIFHDMKQKIKKATDGSTPNKNQEATLKNIDRQMRSLLSDEHKLYEGRSGKNLLDTINKNPEKYKKYLRNEYDSSLTDKEFAEFAGISDALKAKAESLDPNERKYGQQFKDDWLQNHNTDFRGAPKYLEFSHDGALFEAINRYALDNKLNNDEKEGLIKYYTGQSATRPVLRAGTPDSDVALDNIIKGLVDKNDESAYEFQAEINVAPTITGPARDEAIKQEIARLKLDPGTVKISLQHAMNVFQENASEKTVNVFSTQSGRYNTAAMMKIKSFVEQGNYLEASKIASKHGLMGLTNDIKASQTNAMQKQSFVVALDKMIKTNEYLFDPTQQNLNLEQQETRINTDISRNDANAPIYNRAKVALDDYKKTVITLNTHRTDSTHAINIIDPGRSQNLDTIKNNIDAFAADIHANPTHYSDEFINALMPEINTVDRSDIAKQIKSQGSDVKDRIARRLLYLQNPPRTP